MAGPGLAGEQPKLQAADCSALRYTNVESSLRFEGSNTIHDWVVVGREINCSLKAGSGFPAQLRQALAPKEVKVWCEGSIPVKSLKSIERDGSPYSSKFDEIMYERLEAAKYPTIRFRLRKLVQKGVHEGNDVFDASGDLVVRDVTNTVHMPLKVTIMPNGQLKMAGVAMLKERDFKILPGVVCFVPPRDDVRVTFDLTLEERGTSGPD
jgi:hypothetical protein